MKKLSLLLAALMVLCCFAFASCGDAEESSVADVSSTAQTSSEAASSEAEASSEEATSEEASSEAESSEEVVEGPVVSEASMFWVTHFNDGASEGAGAIFTEADNAGGWWIHVAFAPTEVEGLENIYEIVALTNGLAEGTATAVDVPEGGFVWAINTGNNYIELGMGDTDYTSPNCSGMVGQAALWAVGDKIQFAGLDLEGLTIPTDTPDVKWYDDAYVCTATWAFVTE